MKRVYLIRHGQTEWNAAGRWQGALDVHLSQVGIEQAHKLAAFLTRHPITAIYSSDLQRAALTAKIAADALGLEPQFDPRWREFNLGVLSGLTLEDIRVRYPHELQGLHDDYLDHRIEQGESRRLMMERGYQAWQDAVALPGGEIAIFSHGGMIRVLLFKLLDGDPIARSGHIENTSITTLETDGTTTRLIALGQMPHMDEPAGGPTGGEASKL